MTHRPGAPCCELAQGCRARLWPPAFFESLFGIAQVGALIPGVARSGSTLTAALRLASRLLGLQLSPWRGWTPTAGPALALGLVVASISAFFAIRRLTRTLGRFTAWPFVTHRGR
jgi:undecaprenyl-diphosphatase